MNHVEVRPAVESDATSISLLIKELGYDFDTPSIMAKISLAESDPRSCAIVAVADERIVGVISVIMFTVFEEQGYVARITSLIVTSKSRDRGLGGLLVEAAEEFARDRHCVKIEVAGSEHRERSRSFYEARGYDVSHHRFVKQLVERAR